MATAMKFTEENLTTIARISNIPEDELVLNIIGDQEIDSNRYMIIDFERRDGMVFPAVSVTETHFRRNFKFVEPESETEFKKIERIH